MARPRAQCPLCNRKLKVDLGDPDTFPEHDVKYRPGLRCEASHWLVEDNEYLAVTVSA